MAEAATTTKKTKGKKKATRYPKNVYGTYIYKVLKQVHPDIGIKKNSLYMIYQMITDVIMRTSTTSNKLLMLGKRHTVTSREIQTSVRLVLPGELAKHAVSDGAKALTKYSAAPAGGEAPAAGGKKHPHRREAKAGLMFSVSKVEHTFRDYSIAGRKGAGAGVYLAAVVEYLVAEILELAGNATRDSKRAKIKPRHIMLAIRNDEELNRLFSKTVIAGGVVPNIHSVLLPKTETKRLEAKSELP